MSPNRLVAALTPFAALLAGIAAEWLARHFPGISVDKSALEGIFLGGMAAVLAPATVWMFGWQKHEAREGSGADRFEAALESHELALADADDPDAEAVDAEFDEDDDELAGLDDSLAETDVDPLAALELEAAPDLDGEDDAELDDTTFDDALDDDGLAEDEDDVLLAELSTSKSPSVMG